MRKEQRDEWILYYGDDIDIPDVQYNATTRIMHNKWGTILIHLSPDADIDECAKKIVQFDEDLSGALA